ncbi:unnamed protein product [Cyprideis torosa]|uniref:Uncharacterized protein n=1 Tax=Cyprideis torosa TaxID=163714 RepID=A0A7R8WE52_9CRUS|nr:unnamed protein product [Cyprideis torosa]CAG0890314.1 unnamed protein product [Cyprideis torosa]
MFRALCFSLLVSMALIVLQQVQGKETPTQEDLVDYMAKRGCPIDACPRNYQPQLVSRSELDDFSAIQNEDSVAVNNRIQTMGNSDRRTINEFRPKSSLNQSIGPEVYIGRGFV